MKLKTVTGKSLGDSAPMVLGAVGGAMLGRGLTAVIATPAGPTPTQAELDKKMYVQLAMAAAGYVGYSVIDGNDTAAQATKGAAIGIAIDNTIAVISTFAAKSTKLVAKLNTVGTDGKISVVDRFAKASLGLGCPSCETTTAYPAMNRPRVRQSSYRRLGIPNEVSENANNYLGDLVSQGQSMVYSN